MTDKEHQEVWLEMIQLVIETAARTEVYAAKVAMYQLADIMAKNLKQAQPTVPENEYGDGKVPVLITKDEWEYIRTFLRKP